MEDEPDDTTARLMLEWIRECGYPAHLEELSPGRWRAWCEHGGQMHVAVREKPLQALAVVAEAFGFDLEG